MKKEIKAQAALEFLTTYGWAFLVILVMISALAYFGILKPSNILPDKCILGSEIECQDYVISSGTTGGIKLRLKNNLGDTINIIGMNASTEQNISKSVCNVPEADLPTSWKSSSVEEVDFSNCNFDNVGLSSGDKGKVFITITYHLSKTSPSFPHEVKGELYATLK